MKKEKKVIYTTFWECLICYNAIDFQHGDAFRYLHKVRTCPKCGGVMETKKIEDLGYKK